MHVLNSNTFRNLRLLRTVTTVFGCYINPLELSCHYPVWYYVVCKPVPSYRTCESIHIIIWSNECAPSDYMLTLWRINICQSTQDQTETNVLSKTQYVDSSWNVMAHGDARGGKWGGNWRMEWVASALHTTLEHCVSSITTADAHNSAASSRPNWRPRRFKWTRQFRRKTKSGFCACSITFQLASTNK